MIVQFLGPIPVVVAPGRTENVSDLKALVKAPPGELPTLLQDTPHAIEIPYPDDPSVRSLLLSNADRYYMCYTPSPVYFCWFVDSYYVETPTKIHWVETLLEVWNIAKAI